LGVSFDLRSEEVERRLREYALDRIRAITQESRDAIRATEGGSAAPAPTAAKKRGRPAKAAKPAANGAGKKRGRPRKSAAPAEAPAAAE
jgi:hypothetical protein